MRWRRASAADGIEYTELDAAVLGQLAVRYRSERISASLGATILQTIPNRIAYFDALTVVMAPVN